MKLVEEFKTFIARGNVIDMAVGIIIGAAFTGIVNSLVSDVVMPMLGVVTSGMDFSSLFVALDGQAYDSLKLAKDAGAPVISYGVFLNALLNFLIVSFVIFTLVRLINRLKRQEEAKEAAAPAVTPEEVVLLREIRDSLKK